MVTECCWVCPCETFVACRPHYVTLAGLLLWPAHCQTLAHQLETRQFYWSAFAFYRPFFSWSGSEQRCLQRQNPHQGVEEAEGDVGQV